VIELLPALRARRPESFAGDYEPPEATRARARSCAVATCLAGVGVREG
jgi:hypothetical protein